MADLLIHLLLFCAFIARIPGRYLQPTAASASGLHCSVLYPHSMSCHWTPVEGAESHTMYIFLYKTGGGEEFEECKDYTTAGPNSCYFSRANLYLYFTYEIWLKTLGHHGSQMSEKLLFNTEDIAKTEPPGILNGAGRAWQVYVEWAYPSGLEASFFPLIFELRYQEDGSDAWIQEPDVGEQTNYSIYDVTPNRTYVLQVRCKSASERGFWSDWSRAFTVNTTQH
ncbi:cytokine receptor-like factor 1 [Rhinatrema bivittatum]|uniref:cytokine receptor-like factor 1 n=1 Tax=Rhinatrema bivittatum TaxID=194408 RepID=UPI00112BDF0B|nr:cytokine receptor-like factor 1 [Rhinatrema bivittatum]